eukprot:1787694-Rhodomonas_salina.6
MFTEGPAEQGYGQRGVYSESMGDGEGIGRGAQGAECHRIFISDCKRDWCGHATYELALGGAAAGRERPTQGKLAADQQREDCNGC